MRTPGQCCRRNKTMNAARTREAGSAARLDNRQTVVIVGTTLTVGVSICAMILASTLAIRADVRTEFRKLDANLQAMRIELRGEIATLRQELGTKIDGSRRELSVKLNARARASQTSRLTPTHSGANSDGTPAIVTALGGCGAAELWRMTVVTPHPSTPLMTPQTGKKLLAYPMGHG